MIAELAIVAAAVMSIKRQSSVSAGGAVAASDPAGVLRAIRMVEGTAGADGYSIVYGYGHTIQDFSEHPAVTGEWTGEPLSADLCQRAGLGPGCVSTAAGAYQIIKPNRQRARDALGLGDFGPESQDAAALWLVDDCGAQAALDAGDSAAALQKLARVWDGFNAPRWSIGAGRAQVLAMIGGGAGA